MKIEINLKIILFIILFIFLHKIEVYVIFIMFIFLHEMVHMLVGILLGFKPKKIYLNPFGVSISFYNYENIKKLKIKKIIIFLAGPIFNFVVALLFFLTKWQIYYLEEVIYTNMLIGIFNLLPIVYLDGGKALLEFLKYFFKLEFCIKVIINVSKFVLILLSLFYSVVIIKVKNFFILLLIMYCWYLFIKEERKYNQILKMYDILRENTCN